jgi:hypothetical protein
LTEEIEVTGETGEVAAEMTAEAAADAEEEDNN